ncbi:PAAR-like domain-containing protein [Mesorhizobium atlanticum]
MSSTLGDGTTTVFAKGGQMIAIKGSQYKMSTGDEPGTVGGVKSNTFKQATDWTYIFFRCQDGWQQRLPRHRQEISQQSEYRRSDGQFEPGPPGKPNILTIPCTDAPGKPSPGRHKFNSCEQEEICKKLAQINKMMNKPRRHKECGWRKGTSRLRKVA